VLKSWFLAIHGWLTGVFNQEQDCQCTVFFMLLSVKGVGGTPPPFLLWNRSHGNTV
jgi:hypothetical protein